VIDADGHVHEPRDLWDRYIDQAYYDARPICAEPPSIEMTVAGRTMPRRSEWSLGSPDSQRLKDAIRHPLNDPRYGDAQRRDYDAGSYIEAMDRMGIDTMVLYPTRGLYCASVDELDEAVAAAICRAYNRWIAEFCSAAPERLIGAALIPLHGPERAPAEVRYAVETLGLRSLMIRPNPVKGRNLCDGAFDPFFDAVEDLGVAIGVHEGNGTWLNAFGDRFLEEPFVGSVAVHACCHPMEQMGAVLSFTLGGILERHPRLRVAFLESGASWLPYWLARLDEHAERAERRTTGAGRSFPLQRLPSAYFAEHCWIAIEPDDPMASGVVEALGRSRLLWATDYPHEECDPESVVDDFFEAEAFNAEDRRAIVCDNPQQFYGLTPALVG
jgi:predicted TIM-barrel fold metal-dependent hydrolase